MSVLRGVPIRGAKLRRARARRRRRPDHYQRPWEAELGLPWRNIDLWIRISPCFRVDDITTPTLSMQAEDDCNLPALNSEQRYRVTIGGFG